MSGWNAPLLVETSETRVHHENHTCPQLAKDSGPLEWVDTASMPEIPSSAVVQSLHATKEVEVGANAAAVVAIARDIGHEMEVQASN